MNKVKFGVNISIYYVMFVVRCNHIKNKYSTSLFVYILLLDCSVINKERDVWYSSFILSSKVCH